MSRGLSLMTITNLALLVLVGSVLLLLLSVRIRTNKLREQNFNLAIMRRDLGHMQDRLQGSHAQFEMRATTTFDSLMFVDRDRRVNVINPTACDIFSMKEQAPAIVQTLMSVTPKHELDAPLERV